MRYRAACAILDRGGFHIGVDLNVTQRDAREDLSSLSAEQLAERARELSRQFLTARELAIDASVVEVNDELVRIDEPDDLPGVQVRALTTGDNGQNRHPSDAANSHEGDSHSAGEDSK